jgi:hypothetical protein
MVRARSMWLLLGGWLTLATALPAFSQDPKEAPDVKPSDAASLREQTIYIPYGKLRENFEKEGRGVFIPYERFQELWKAARAAQRKPTDAKPLTPAVITEADSEATVGKEVVRVAAKLKIDVLETGWVEVPLRLEDAGVMSATLVRADGKQEPARLSVAQDGSHKLVIENQTKRPLPIELRLEYAKAFNKTPGRNDVSFAAPQAPINRWKVRVAERGVKVHIEPLIAATEPPSDANPTDEKKLPQETVLLAFVGGAANVKIDWTAKAEGASGLAALASVEAQQEVRVEEGVMRTRARLTYTISRAELAQLTIEVPADQKVVNVSDPNVRQWSVKTVDKVQQITVHLFEPARTTQSVQVELEQFTAGAAAKPAAAKPADAKPKGANGIDAKPDALTRRAIEVPVVKSLDVSRQQGVVVVDVAEGWQIEASKREGLAQLDAAELPQPLAGQPHELAYRYAALPFALSLDAFKVKPRVLADELVLAYLEPEQLKLQLRATYTIERAGVFELALDVPADYEIRDVRGDTSGGAAAAQVDSHHLEGADKTRLVVELTHKALGRVGLFVELQKRVEDANLLGPTGKTSEIALPVPRVAPDTIERTNGRLVLLAPESLRVNPGKQSGLRNVSLTEALAGAAIESAATRPVSSFVYTKAPLELSLLVERRKPYVSVGQLLVARVELGVVKYDATFFYDIRYSGVKSLRIDVPSELAPDIRNNTPGVTEKEIAPAPADVDKGYLAWSLTGESQLLGAVAVKLSWERKLENVEVGKSIEITIPKLLPREADRAWGQIVLVKSETIDLAAAGAPSGLRPIDPQHDLMPGASVSDAALAFEFHDDWSLAATATRYQLESVKHTSIDRGLVRAVVTRSGQLAVQALYRMRSARQRLAVTLPDGVEFDTEPLRINGTPTPLERGAKDEYFVPLVGRGNNESFLLELRYTLAKSGSLVVLPTFIDEPAVQKVYISAFLPQELKLLGHIGPWTDEERREQNDLDLVNWVREGVPVTGNPADTFHVDGQLLVFSTLRPEGGASDGLRLNTLNGNWLQFLVFGAVLAAGLLLLGRPLLDRAAALAALVIVLLLVGVFLPTFSKLLFADGLWLAIGLTALVWTGLYLVSRGRRTRTTATSAAVPEPPPPEVAAASPIEGSPGAAPPSESPPSEPPPSSDPPSTNPPTEGDAQQGGEHHG